MLIVQIFLDKVDSLMNLTSMLFPPSVRPGNFLVVVQYLLPALYSYYAVIPNLIMTLFLSFVSVQEFSN